MNIVQPAVVKTLPIKPEFDFASGELVSKHVYTVWGDKGCGKTATALGFPGTIFAISFDRKTARIHESMFNDDKRITVKDGLFHYKENMFDALRSSVKSLDWVKYLLNEITAKVAKKEMEQPDYIFLDYLPKLSEMAERKMRLNNNIGLFQGFPNLTLWKERNMYLREIHNLALDTARRGVIYSTYIGTDYKGQKITEGQIVDSVPVPHYTDIAKEETDVVIRQLHPEQDKDGKTHWRIRIESNKIKYEVLPLVSGEIIDLTGRSMADVFKERVAK